MCAGHRGNDLRKTKVAKPTRSRAAIRRVVMLAIGLASLGAVHPALAQVHALSVGPRVPLGSFGNVGRVDPGFRYTPPSDGGSATVSSNNSPSKTKHSANRNSTRNAINGVPPANERRYASDEVVLLLKGKPPTAVVEALARGYHLTRLESQSFGLLGDTTAYRWRIPSGRTVASVTAELAADRRFVWVQPNYYFEGQQSELAGEGAERTQREGEIAQYAIAKLRLSEAHGLATGDKVLVAVIDSGIDTTHPELQGVIAGQFDAVGSSEGPHPHGTAIAGIIAAHARLVGAAPAVHILAVRAFGAASNGAEGTTFNIIKGLDWATSQGARIVNMSFAGPPDPLLQRATAGARQKGAILIAAAGNAGPKSPPLYPAADPNVIAVTATDADDHLFAMANHGSYIAAAAPGVDVLVPVPGGGYQVSSGTSYAAAYVSGVAALILERRPKLLPEAARRILLSTAKDLGPKGRDDQFGAGLVDAYQAIMSLEPKSATTDAPSPALQ
jgi:Subtilase family